MLRATPDKSCCQRRVSTSLSAIALGPARVQSVVDERHKMRFLVGILLAAALGAGTLRADGSRPKPNDVIDFVADPISSAGSDYFKDFKVTQKKLDTILNKYFQVEEEHWKNGYSHVAFGDRTGHVIMKDGRKVKWMVRPGGLAWLEFPSGKKMYLAAEKTEWLPTK